MNNYDIPENNSARLAELQESLAEKGREMKEKLQEMKKKFSALKTKVNKYEKVILTLDEEHDRTSLSVVSFNAQLALNKYADIEKKIAKCTELKNNFERECKQLPVYAAHSTEYLTERDRWMMTLYYNFITMSRDVTDKIRIAHKHLKKIDSFFAFVRSLRRGR